MLKKNKSKKKITKKMRNSTKSRKMKKGGTVYKGKTVNKGTASTNMPTISENENMTDTPAPASVLNKVANNVKSIMTLRKRKEPVKNEELFTPKTVSNKSNYEIWLEMADKQFTKKEYEEYRAIVGNCDFKDKELKKKYNKKMSSFACQEQYWTNHNFTVIADFMGNPVLWEIMVPNVDLRKTKDINKVPKTNRPVATYTGSHWLSRKAGVDSKNFDPYDEYQILGSNQFCQTYAMMNLIEGSLPEPIAKDNSGIAFISYYVYTEKALKFINDNVPQHVDAVVNKVKDKIDNLIKLIDNGEINDKNKKKLEIKQNIRDYIIDDNENIHQFDERYKTLTIEEIKQQLNEQKYYEENRKTIIKKAIRECYKHPNLCLNVIEYNFENTKITH